MTSSTKDTAATAEKTNERTDVTTVAQSQGIFTPQKPAPLSPPFSSPAEESPEAATPPSTFETPTSNDDSGVHILFKVILEGIPEALQKQSLSSTTTRDDGNGFEQRPVWDDSSLETLLSSLEGEDEFSLDESYYFTPLEERPGDRLGRMERELQLRWEYLENVCLLAHDEVPPTYAERLLAQEEQVQSLKREAAHRREEERNRQRAQRRAQRRRQREQLQRTQQEKKTAVAAGGGTRTGNPVETPLKRQKETSEKDAAESTPAKDSVEKEGVAITPTRSPDFKTNASTPEKFSPKSLFGLTSTTTSTTTSGTTQDPNSAVSTPKIIRRGASMGIVEYLTFEWYNAVPAICSLVLSCLVHAALYELCLTLVMVGMNPFVPYRVLTDSDDNILEQDTRTLYVEDTCYGVVLTLGVILARCSGLLYSSLKDPPQPGDPQREKGRRRIDQRLSTWLNYTKRGRLVKGFMDVMAFYLCFVAVMYFMNRFALMVDQRSAFLQDMPSNRHQQQQESLLPHAPMRKIDASNLTFSNGLSAPSPLRTAFDGTCPAHVRNILLPMDLEGDTQYTFDIIDCDGYGYYDEDDEVGSDDDDDEEDVYGEGNHEPIHEIYECGQEDEAYLYQHLSAYAYSQFWGYGYRAALFDLPHQLLFNAILSVFAIYTLKRYFCSFWDSW